MSAFQAGFFVDLRFGGRLTERVAIYDTARDGSGLAFDFDDEVAGHATLPTGSSVHGRIARAGNGTSA